MRKDLREVREENRVLNIKINKMKEAMIAFDQMMIEMESEESTIQE
jgi:hypothetical protein